MYHSSKMNSIRTGKKPKKVKKTNPSFAPSKKRTGGVLEIDKHTRPGR